MVTDLETYLLGVEVPGDRLYCVTVYVLPVRMSGWQQKHELNHADSLLHLIML